MVWFLLSISMPRHTADVEGWTNLSILMSKPNSGNNRSKKAKESCIFEGKPV